MNTNEPSSTAVAPNGTAISNSTAIPSSTAAVAPSGTAVSNSTAIASGTAIPSEKINNKSTGASDVPEYDEYVIDGIRYRFKSIISSQSGEAKIILVSVVGKEFALKIYKPGHHPDHKVLQTLNKVTGNGLLIDIYAHGIWTDKDGQEYDYELMQYCKGKSLASIKLNNDENKLKEIAKRMAAAIDFCHQNNILHRDIKPANFLFTDTDESEFVLTDFGIARHFNNEGKVAVDFYRTQIYAAPEMYDYIPGEQTYLTKSSDWYAMGMSLLALWMGEGVFSANERELLKNKKEGTIPFPKKDISTHMLSLLKALTILSESKRATYEDIERWANGQIIFKEPHTINNNISGFRVVFSSKTDEELIAYSTKELGEMMWQHKSLAKRYLYSEQVSKWLRNADRPEDAMEMDEITEKLYPSNQDAGLYAACLVLNPELKYIGKKGNEISTKEEFAEELFNNLKSYSSELSDLAHPFWIYCNKLGLNHRIKALNSMFKKNPTIALLCFVYDLDQTRPYITEINGKVLTISHLPALFKTIEDGTLNDNNILKLYTNDFTVWARNQNPDITRKWLNLNDSHLSESLRIWRLLYALAPGYGYDFKEKNKSDMFTCEDIMHELTNEIMGQSNRSFNLSSQICNKNFDNTRLAIYLESKKVYQNSIKWIKYCFEFNSDDNQKKYGPYNRRIALMKVVYGITNKNVPLTLNGVTIHNLKEFEKEPKLKCNKLNEMQIDLLVDWLALQFIEDPNLDYEKKSYFDRTHDYWNYLNNHVHNSSYIKASNAITNIIKTAKSKFNNAQKKVSAVKWGVTILCLIPMLIACCIGILTLISSDSNIFNDLLGGVGNVVGGIVGIIVGLYLLFKIHWLIGIIGCYLVYQGIMWLFLKLSSIIPWVITAIIVIIAISYIYRFLSIKKQKLNDTWSNMDLDDAEKFAKIGAAFNSTQKLLPSLPSNYPACVYENGAIEATKQIKSLRKDIFITLGITIASLFFTYWIIDKSAKLEEKKQVKIEQPTNISTLAGDYFGKFDGHNASISLNEKIINHDNVEIEGTVRVIYDSPMEHIIIGKVNVNSDEDISLYKVTDNGAIDYNIVYKIINPKKINEKNMLIGVFTNKNKNKMYEFSLEKR